MATWGCHVRNFLCSFAVGAIVFMGLGARPAGAAPPPRSSILEVAATGRVLEAQDPDGRRHPASLTKLMTLYMTFQALRDRRITMGEFVPVSPHAASMQPTKLGLTPGMRITVHQAILGLITRSANDAAVALGELLGGSEARFAQMMTLRAHALGMRRTNFVNASGLPAAQQWSTARDMALLARRLITDFPQYYPLFSTPDYVFHGQTVVNLDRMLKLYPGVDGMKTGFVDASGHNLVTSAIRNGVRLIAVEFGARTNARCYARMAALLNQGYDTLGVPTGAGPALLAGAAPRLPALIARAHAETVAHRPPPPVRRIVSLHAVPARWAIQVGSFRSRPAAWRAAARARRATRGGPVRLERVADRGNWLWRAQVTGFTEHGAYGACRKIAHGAKSCFVVRALPPRRFARG